MPNCVERHQPQTAALVICRSCYRALTERTVSMEHDKLIAILTACSNRKGNRCSQCPAFGKGDRQCASNAMRAAAVVLKAQDAKLAAAKKCIYDVETYLHLGSAKYIRKTIDRWRGPQEAGEGGQ